MYKYHEDEQQEQWEGRFWNCNGVQIAIVAVVTKGIDWAAYIGSDAPHSWHEIDTCNWAARHGDKLSESDAIHFFPDIDLPYRD